MKIENRNYTINIRPPQTLVNFDVHIARFGGQLTMILALNPLILEISQIFSLSSLGRIMSKQRRALTSSLASPNDES